MQSTRVIRNVYRTNFPKYERKKENKSTLNDNMTGVREYICLHFGADEARTTMAELEKCGHDMEPQACYINILRRLFPDIKPKVLQLLLVACDSDLIKTVETILPCCKKMKTNGHITYTKVTSPPTKMMMLSRAHKFPTRILDKRDMLRYTPYPIGRTFSRYPSLFVPPYTPVPSNDNCGLCIPSRLLPPYYISKGSPDDVLSRSQTGFPYYTTPKYNFAECKTVTSSPTVEIEDTRTTTAAATLISLSNS
ncbi:uncharacterized protein LOC114532518 isoform X2 [Dendronephthya gigantea]|uniref:uncharacterized protein LOC114532518 isoform X2 n=1 Tax=Dendronephthya gigantea TaxID=151771 RepID=UPI00106B6454|nr:uncharacterized protein LOC114532518 isoform X2 [Dendronephthya gigantea]